MQSKPNITATGQYDLTNASPSTVSCVMFTLFGFTGSLIPQKKIDTGGVPGVSPNYFNCGYTDTNTGTWYAPGTAITTDGMYIADTSGAMLSLNVTNIGDGSFDVNYWPLEGLAPSGGSIGLSASEAFIGHIGGTVPSVAVELVRPADTAAYIAGDAITDSTSAPTILPFANAVRIASGTAYITKARIETNQAANVAAFRL